MTVAEAGLRVKVGDVTHEITADGLETTNGTIKHDTKDIGKTHRHRDVQPGSALTGVPA